MSSENDVPLGEGAQRYYEEQFRDRIRQVRKSGRFPRGAGRSNWGGRAVVGSVIGLFLLIRIILAIARTHSTPQYTYTSPTPPTVQPNWQNERKDREVNVNGVKILQAPADPLPLEPNAILGVNPALTEDEVPYWTGLCYRIYHEGLRREPTPGGRICQLLDVSTRGLIAKAARGQLLGKGEKADLLGLLNEVLQRKDFYHAASFHKVPGVAHLLLGLAPDADDEDRAQFNRLLLEKCYPEQIVPFRERTAFQNKWLNAWEIHGLEARKREQWQRRARADYDRAKQQYEPAKP